MHFERGSYGKDPRHIFTLDYFNLSTWLRKLVGLDNEMEKYFYAIISTVNRNIKHVSNLEKLWIFFFL